MALRGRQKWARIRAAYLAGETDLHKLAVRFRVDEALLVVRAAAEGWAAERKLIADESADYSDLSLAIAAWRRERIRVGRLGLLNARALLEAEQRSAKELAYLMTAAQRALPAHLTLPDGPGDGELADLTVVEADGGAWNEATGRQLPAPVAAEPGGTSIVRRKPE